MSYLRRSRIFLRSTQSTSHAYAYTSINRRRWRNE